MTITNSAFAEASETMLIGSGNLHRSWTRTSGEMDFPAVDRRADERRHFFCSTGIGEWWQPYLVVEDFGDHRFREPQEFRCWFDGKVWQVRGPFRVDYFADSYEEAVSDLFNCLTMLWDVYADQSPTRLTGDALELREELRSAIE